MNLLEYSKALDGHMQADEFLAMSPLQQQQSIAGVRNWYLQENPNANAKDVDAITEWTNKSWLRNIGEGRALPIININLPSQDPGFKDLNKEEQLQKIEEYKLKIPEIAATAPTFMDAYNTWGNPNTSSYASSGSSILSSVGAGIVGR